MEKTHYRKAFNSPYLSSADIVEPTVLTVKCVKLESDKSKKSKDVFNTAYFAEKRNPTRRTAQAYDFKLHEQPNDGCSVRFQVYR